MGEITTIMQHLMLSMMVILEMTLLVIQAMTVREQTRIQNRNNKELPQEKEKDHD